MANVTLKKKTAGGTEELHPKTNWSQVGSKPTSFTPASHTHGNITNDGKIGTTANRVVVTSTGGQLIAKSAGNTSQFLRGDGAWAVPPVTGGGGNAITKGTIYGYRSGENSRGSATLASLCTGVSLFSRIQIFKFSVHLEQGAQFDIYHSNGTYTSIHPIEVIMTTFATSMTGTSTTATCNMIVQPIGSGASEPPTMLVRTFSTDTNMFFFETEDSYEIELEGAVYSL